MRRYLLALAFAVVGAGPLSAQEDPLGTLTFDGPGSVGHHAVLLTSLFFSITPGQRPTGDDPAAGHTVTVTSAITSPDAALIAWATGPDRKRHVTLELRDDPDVPPRSVIQLEDAAVTGLTVGYGGGGRGQQTLEITAEHMTVDGQPVY